jgi:hypothetical protein
MALLPRLASAQGFFPSPGYQGSGGGIALNRPNEWKALQTMQAGLTVSGGAVTITRNDNNLILDTPGAAQYASLYFYDNGVSKWGFFKDTAHHLTWQPTGSFVVNIKNSAGATMLTLSPLAGAGITLAGANGQEFKKGHKTELTPIAASPTTATTITIPANAILRSVAWRVMVITATTSGTVLQQGASASTAINTTDVGTRAWGTNYVGVAAQTITITPNATPSDATGRIRFELVYDEPVAPTS